MLTWILILAFCVGQLIKVPSFNSAGATLLDLTVLFLSLIGIFKIKMFKSLPLPFLIASIFIFFCILSLIFTPLKLKPIEYLLSVSYIIRFGLYIFAGYLISCKIFKIDLAKIITYSTAILSVLGLIQLIFLPDLKFLASLGWDPHFFRTVSTFLDPNFLGAFLVMGLIFFLSNYKQLKNKKNLMAFTIIYIALMTTFSRSSYLMFLVSGLSLSFFKKSFKLSLIIVLLFIALLIAFQIYIILVSKPRNIDRGYSASARLNTWQQAFGIFSKSPVLGVGFNTYKYALEQYNLTSDEFTNSRGASSNDSSLLHVLTTTGVVGFTTYLIFIFSLIKIGFKYKNNGSLILSSIVLGLLIHSLFNNSLFYPHILFLIILLTGSISLTKDNKI